MSAPLATTALTGARSPWPILGIICLGTFTQVLDQAGVNLALPVLATAFGSSVAAIGWVALTHMIALVTSLAIFGRLADLVGRKPVYVGGMALLMAGSLLGALAPSLGWLVAARVVTGLGAAMSVANVAALIGAHFPPERRGTAIGLTEASVALAMATAPILGGLLIEAVGWRAVFLLTWPAGLACIILALLILDDPAPAGSRQTAAGRGRGLLPTALCRLPTSARGRFDVPGASLFAAGVASLLLGLTNGASLGWGSPRVLAALGIGAALLILFVRVEQRVAHPMIALSLFRHPVFAAAFRDVFRLTTAACLLGLLLTLIGKRGNASPPASD